MYWKPYSLFVIDTTFASDNPLYFIKNLSERIYKLIMRIDDKIKYEKLQFDINREAAKIFALSSGKIDKYEYLTGKAVLPSDQSRIIEQARFIYFPLRKTFERQIKTIEDQGEKQIKALEEHEKQLLKYSNEKEFLTHLKQKEIFKELVNRRMEEPVNRRMKEIWDLRKQIDFNNLIYHYKNKTVPKKFSLLKVH